MLYNEDLGEKIDKMKSTEAANEVNEKKTNDLAASDVSIQCLDYGGKVPGQWVLVAYKH